MIAKLKSEETIILCGCFAFVCMHVYVLVTLLYIPTYVCVCMYDRYACSILLVSSNAIVSQKL